MCPFSCDEMRAAPMVQDKSYVQKGTNEVSNKTRHLLALTGCAVGMVFTAPAALAQSTATDPPIAEDSPIQADEGVVLAETVDPGTSSAGEASCSAPALFNPLMAFK